MGGSVGAAGHQLGDRGQPLRSRGCLRPRGRVDPSDHRGVGIVSSQHIERTFEF